MNISGITWRGESLDDVELLRELPYELLCTLSETNGFVLHSGALHVRGASLAPEWHSLRAAWKGASAFHILYETVHGNDIPFAQDLLGDQFLLRDGRVFRLSGETGDVEPLAASLEEFFSRVSQDIEGFPNVGLSHSMEPGELLLAYPPFVCRESGAGAHIKPVPAGEVIRFHADLARQIKDVPDGGQIQFKLKGS